jgi:hypothetical protein
MSGRNRRALQAFDRLLQQFPDVPHFTGRTPIEISAALKKLASEQVELVAINGGDGTVQAVLTSLFEEQPFSGMPLLAILAGGTTNMDAGDIGLRGRGPRALRRLLSWAANTQREPAVVERPVLRVQAGNGSPIRYGMFLGAGAIVEGIEHFHGKVRTKGLRDAVGPAVSIMRMLIALVRKHERYAVNMHANVRAVPGPSPDASGYFMLSASALEHLYFGIKPYWGDTDGCFYFNAISASPRRPLRALPPLFLGRANRFASAANGYFSHKVDALDIAMEGRFTLDGEIYPIRRADGPLQVRGVGPLSFVRL